MVEVKHTREEILSCLSEITDPEIPVVTIQEIGMLRDVEITDEGYNIILTPTYTGCPAMGIIEADIKSLLNGKGIHPVTVRTIYSPAWTTDWISDKAKEKMRSYGIAPPVHSTCASENLAQQQVACPQCGSTHTEIISQYGATACKALYRCNDCKEPFEYFKCH